MPFQTQVNLTQAPAVEGDFASTNPRHSLLSTPGGWVAGTGGVTIGRFAWADTTGTILANAGTGAPSGFVRRNLQALITTYLAESGMVIPTGFPVGDVYAGGDFWVKNTGAGAVTVGLKAFASNTTGAIQFAATGATVAGNTETKYFAMTAGAAGELIKMSNTPLG
jgi:hypothetical protein